MNELISRNIPLISTIILTNIVIFNSPVKASLTTEEINNIASKIVVSIKGTNQASGVIISKSENTYGILTTWESVKTEGYYEIITPDGKSYPITNKKQILGADLAIIYFNSKEKYTIAKLGNSDEIKLGEMFYVGGYSMPSQGKQKPEYRFYSRDLVQMISKDKTKDGYQLIYIGSGLPGMSGSAIINSNGRLIGIYGKTITDTATLQANLLGIPINIFEKLAKGVDINLERPTTNINVSNLPVEPKLISKTTKINYTPLRNFLAAKRWEEADKITLTLMLDAVNSEDTDWFTSENIAKFPCDDFSIINNLWSKYSNNRFGFQVQEKIYLDSGNKLNNYDLITFRNFGDTIGWRENGEWLSKDNLIYNENAPTGHLPIASSKRLGVYLGLLFSSCQP